MCQRRRSTLGVFECVVDDGVGMRIGYGEAVGARGVVRRVAHRQYDVDLVGEHLPALADAHVRRVRGREAEDIGRDGNAER